MSKLPAKLELVRPINCLLTGVAVLIGAIVASEGLDLPIDAFLAFVVAALVAAGGYSINDYFDREIDKTNRPWRPIPSGRIGVKEALAIASTLFVLGIVLAIFLNLYCLILAVLNLLVLVFYSWKLKRKGLMGNISIGYLVGSTFLFGSLAVGERDPSLPLGSLVLVSMAGLSTIGRELVKDIEDMLGDRKLGFKSFPLCHGTRNAAFLTIPFIGSAIGLSPIPYLFGIFGWAYLVFVVPSIAIFIYAAANIVRNQDRENAKRVSSMFKIAMMFGLLGFLTGSLS